jgi:peptide deformylase
MTLLNILCFPDERLRSKAKAVTTITSEHQQIVDDMLETMYAAPGIGLAATQVNIHQQIIVIDISAENNQPYCFINPQIITATGHDIMQEGCLSVPETYADIERAESVVVTYLDRQGNNKEIVAEGLLAVCLQHEIDHLQGKLFVDYLSKLKRDRIAKKFVKQQRRM